jgi:hypothetical protein
LAASFFNSSAFSSIFSLASVAFSFAFVAIAISFVLLLTRYVLHVIILQYTNKVPQ